MKKLLTILVMLAVPIGVYAQQIVNVSGIITAKDNGDPLASVLVISGDKHALTDNDGKYSIEASKDGTILFSLMGMKELSLPVPASGRLDVSMEDETLQLDETVVVGYGTQRRRDLTGSITTVSGESLRNTPSNSPLQALQGKVPGLYIVNSGFAEGTPSVTLRGVSTVRASSAPLYVVDEMLTDNISWLNINDIESMEVLKDASSTAMYGVQGANGVIIITTRKADGDGVNVSYNGTAGVSVVHKRDRLALCDADEFTLLYNELLKNMNPEAETWVPDLTGKGTDWIDEVLRPATFNNHTVTLSRGGKNGSSITSLSFLKNDGVVKYNSYTNANLRHSSEYKIGKWLKAGVNANVRYRKTNPTQVSLTSVARVIPTYAPYDDLGYYDENNLGSIYTPAASIQKDVGNPVATMEIKKGTSHSYGYQGVLNGFIEATFLKDFTLRAAAYTDATVQYSDSYNPKYYVTNGGSTSSQYSRNTSFSRSTGEYIKTQGDITLSYKKVTDKFRINAVVGVTAKEYVGKSFSASIDSLISGSYWNIPEDMRMLSLGDDKSARVSDSYSSNSFLSYLGRVNFTGLDKYLFTATLRYDGSSKFGTDHRWGLFPSVGLGWIMTEEPFMKNLSHIDFLKLRTSFGQAGNDKIGDYLAYPTINPKGTSISSGGETYYLPVTAYQVDQNIHWEIVTTIDAGVDFRMFRNRFSGELGYYYKRTSDLLAQVSPTISVGSGYAITNAGSLSNQGIEFMLSWEDRKGDFNYGLNVNGSTVRNEVIHLGNDDAYITSGNYHRTAVGQPVGSFYGYRADGIIQTQEEADAFNEEYSSSYVFKAGDIRYKDLNGDGKFNDKDREFIGKTIPSFIYGFGISLGYRNMDLKADFNGVVGVQILNTKYWQTYSQFNYYKDQLDRWHGEGTSNRLPVLDGTRPQNQLCSDAYIESGSYLRLRNLQIGYTFPDKITKAVGLSSVRFFVQAQNLLTFKHNSGYTPEIGGSLLSANVDEGGTYPIPTTYTFGLNLNF